MITDDLEKILSPQLECLVIVFIFVDPVCIRKNLFSTNIIIP